jgi:tetratricopeptide (TPR) repeat protein
MADVPLYVLTDENVFSAGEGFTHALQALGRATVIGETTGGGAHITRPFMIGARFEAKIPWARAINPITGTNWEGVGVTPDVEVPSDEALDVALEMAREAVVAKREERETAGFATLDDVIEKIRGAEQSLGAGDLAASRSTLWGAFALGIDSGVLHEGLVDDIGHHYLDRGEVDMAIEVFSFAAETYPKSHNAFYSLAEAYVKKGNAALAEASLARSLELRPGGAWAVKLLTNIDEEIRKAREE